MVLPNVNALQFTNWLLTQNFQRLTAAQRNLITIINDAALNQTTVTEAQYNGFIQISSWRYPYYQTYVNNTGAVTTNAFFLSVLSENYSIPDGAKTIIPDLQMQLLPNSYYLWEIVLNVSSNGSGGIRIGFKIEDNAIWNMTTVTHFNSFTAFFFFNLFETFQFSTTTIMNQTTGGNFSRSNGIIQTGAVGPLAQMEIQKMVNGQILAVDKIGSFSRFTYIKPV